MTAKLVINRYKTVMLTLRSHGIYNCSQVKEIHVDANPAADVTDQRNGE